MEIIEFIYKYYLTNIINYTEKQCILNCACKSVHSATSVVCRTTTHRCIQLCMLEQLSPHDHE